MSAGGGAASGAESAAPDQVSGRLPAEMMAPAKLTLSLRITGVRPDGFHLLDAEMATIDFGDTLTFTPGNGLHLVMESTASSGEAISLGADNLVSRALVLVERQAKVTLRKRIPAGGGLGGGSADAAAVLRWAGCDDLALAATLGSDVPFCLLGGRGRVRGVGEIVDRLPPGEWAGESVTLATPPFGVSTPAVYRAWDVLGGPTADGPNDLEAAALAVEPRLATWRDVLWRVSGQRPVLAGSGSTWFVRGAFPGAGRVVAKLSGA